MTYREVPCPQCSAPAGRRCHTTGRTGKTKKRKAHTARVRAAKAVA